MAPSRRRTTARQTRVSSDRLEQRTRSECGFNAAESSLSSVSSNQGISRGRHAITTLLSYLGSSNPLPAPLEKDDVVWLLDNTAFRGPGGIWQAEFVAAAFDRAPSARVVDIVGDIASKLGLSNGHVEERTIERRIAPFVMQILPGRQIKVDFDGVARLKLGPGGRNGISSDLKRLPKPPRDMVARSNAVVPRGATGMLEMKTVYAEPEGWAVISDVDDTIKVTQTSDPIGILRSTFVSEPEPVAGMPELYAYIQTVITNSAPFFYLSASPYNLYPFLRRFRDNYYPHGELILRDASWLTVSGLLSSLTLGTEKYKIDRMRKIRRWFPRRKMILIGDSTQSDPEAYGEICRMFPGWIKLILIRKVTDIAAVGIEEKNEPARFERAFTRVPRKVWHVFEDPADCWRLVHDTVQRDGDRHHH